MYRSKENLLESVDEPVSSDKEGVPNPTFDYTTESSIQSEYKSRNPRITVRSGDFDTPKNVKKPVPLPRSKIPRLLTADQKSTKRHLNVQIHRDKSRDTEDDAENQEKGSNDIPLATFTVNNEKKQRKHKNPKIIEESSIVSSTDDLSATETNEELSKESKSSPSGESKKKPKKARRTKLKPEKIRTADISDCNDKIGIYIHELDFLKYTMDIESVFIRTSLYEQTYGILLNKHNPVKQNGAPEEIEPILTKACRFRNVSYLNCVWEQLVVFEENTKSLKNGQEIIFFEVLVQSELTPDLNPVAFAFLKPFKKDHYNNFDKRLMLQVYHYKKKLNIYQNWQNIKKAEKYPSTLTITLKSVETVKEDTKEASVENIVDTPFEVNGLNQKFTGNIRNEQRVSAYLNLSGKGTNFLKVNGDGSLIAIANPQENGSHNIIIAAFPTLKTVQILEGHSNFIYDLKWKDDDKSSSHTLMSCSADHTLVVWTIDKDYNYSYKVIPHSTYLYCCVFWSKEYLISAGKDSIIRVWAPHRGTYKIHQELSKGTGYVTCLVVCNKRSVLYSANSDGLVIEWLLKNGSFEFHRKIFQAPSKIFHIELHSRIDKLFVGVDHGRILCLDMESLVNIQTFEMLPVPSSGAQFKFKISNCGLILISVCGDYKPHCWNIVSGNKEPLYSTLFNPTGMITSVDIPKKGSSVVFGKYKTNKEAVVVLTSERSLKSNKMLKPEPQRENKENVTTTAVKTKLHEIIEKIDQVLVLPQLCDDDKINLSQDMINEKRRIEEWLDQNVETAASESDAGTFDVPRRQDSIKSNGTFTVQKSEVTVHDKEQAIRISSEDEDINGGTYEIKKRDTDADDTSISDFA